jgi:predicted DNA binding CopG/RHH family protein
MKTSKTNLRSLPALTSDAAAEKFLTTADLSTYDLSGFRPMAFEFAEKDARITMRMPQQQLAALKAEAKKRRMPYQRFMRHVLALGIEAAAQELPHNTARG